MKSLKPPSLCTACEGAMISALVRGIPAPLAALPPDGLRCIASGARFIRLAGSKFSLETWMILLPRRGHQVESLCTAPSAASEHGAGEVDRTAADRAQCAGMALAVAVLPWSDVLGLAARIVLRRQQRLVG
jgi:hypothetical protein